MGKKKIDTHFENNQTNQENNNNLNNKSNKKKNKSKKNKENKNVNKNADKNADNKNADINKNKNADINKNTKNKELNNQYSTLDQIIKPKNKEFLTYFKNMSLNKNEKEFQKEMKDYQESFHDMEDFSKSISTVKKNAINCIIYHAENSDGIMSANIAVNYLLEHKKKDIYIIPTKPSSGAGYINSRLKIHEDQMKDKNILILDLQYNKENLDYIRKLAKNVYIIDDHKIANSNNNLHFVGQNHASIAYTWKFFYPKESIPLYVQIIDNDDRKLQLPFLAKYRKLSSFYNYRIFHNPYLKIKFDKVDDFQYLNSVISDEFKVISNIIGHYYEELANNIKDQVARNARKATFQGHPVYVLNYNDPVLSRMVGRQMITNAKAKGDAIHFAVLWGYEYTNQCYRIQLVEDHSGKPKYNLPRIAKTLGNIGGTGKGGGGANFVGNFYWPHNNNKDIWDLFSKNYLKNKYN